MTTPSKLAVEIAEALNHKLSGILTAETVTALAALIDAKLAPLVEDGARWKDCAEYGWTVIANASGGDWKKESADWQKAAAKFRDECYYKCLDQARAQRPAQEGSE